MECPGMVLDEAGRLRALADYCLSPGEGLPSLQPIVAMAARMFGCPTAAVNLVGCDETLIAASFGLGPVDLDRDISFCAHAIRGRGVMVIRDATRDIRFCDNPLVTGGAIRFYAGAPLRAPSGNPLGALCVIDSRERDDFYAQDGQKLLQLADMVCDRLELRRLDMARHRGAARFATALATSDAAVITCDARRVVDHCNVAAAALFGHSPQSLAGLPLETLIAPSDRAIVAAALARDHDGGLPQATTLAVMGQRDDASEFPAELQWNRDRHDGVTLLVRNLSGETLERTRLTGLVHHDAATGLPGRTLLFAQIEDQLRAGASLAVIVIAVEGVAEIDAMHGHHVGDAVLREIAGRLRIALPEASLLARKTGHRFAAVMPTVDPLELARAARAVQAALEPPCRRTGETFHIDAWMGLAIAPATPIGAEELVGNAQLALEQARSGGFARFKLYTPHLRAEALARRRFDADIRRAFADGEFVLHYQPQVRLSDEQLVGVETLLRWHHPERGLLPPAGFLDALEASPLAKDVGTWVLRTACAQAAIWRRSHPGLTVAVNLFCAQLRDGDLPAIVAEALARHGLPPGALELEITENSVIERHDAILHQLEAIRASGVRLAFDDFGTGHASLSLLCEAPVTTLKIDRSFVQHAHGSTRDRPVVQAIIGMGRALGLEIIAEGIEDPATAAFLRQAGCTTGQGYLFGKPCSADVIDALLWGRRSA